MSWALASDDLHPNFRRIGGIIHKSASGHSGIYIAETLAAAYALSLPVKNLHLLIDNLAVVQRLRSIWTTILRSRQPYTDPFSPAAGLWAWIVPHLKHRAAAGHTITVTKVKSHATPQAGGHPLNHAADDVANRVRRGEQDDNTSFRLAPVHGTVLLSEPSSTFDSVLPASFYGSHAKHFSERLQSSYLFHWLNPDSKHQRLLLASASSLAIIALADFNAKRKQRPFRFETRLLSNTLPCPAFLHRMGSLPSPTCLLCPHSIADQAHVLLACPATLPTAVRTTLQHHPQLLPLLPPSLRRPQWQVLLSALSDINDCLLDDADPRNVIMELGSGDLLPMPHTIVAPDFTCIILFTPNAMSLAQMLARALYTLYCPTASFPITTVFRASLYSSILCASSVLAHFAPLRRLVSSASLPDLVPLAGLLSPIHLPSSIIRHRTRLSQTLRTIFLEHTHRAWLSYTSASH